MANIGNTYTDRKLAALERKLAMVYGESRAELDEAVDHYYNGWDEVKNGKKIHHKGLQERYEEEFAKYQSGMYHDENGVYTDDEMFARWWWSQEGRGKHLESMRDDMARAMTETNVRAAGMINDTTPGIYSMNANWTAYTIEVAHRDYIEKNKGIAFNLVNEQTVKELVNEKNHVEFRVNSVNRKRDYEWNKKQINKAVLSGILQGDSVYDVANRYMDVMKRNRNAAIRNARTSVTSAQNAGYQNAYTQAEKMGIKIQKQWMSTRDSRTRDSHLLLNGEKVGVNDKFSNGLMYPGDADGEPAEVYNCRCTMVTVDPAVEKVNADPYNKKGFDEWLEQTRSDFFKNSNNSVYNNTGRDIIKMNLQLFAEKDLENQESASLVRAIRKYNKRIEEHKQYIDNPYEHCPDWDEKTELQKKGLIKHWNKEIRVFTNQINDRIAELKKRGDYNE